MLREFNHTWVQPTSARGKRPMIIFRVVDVG